MLASRGHKRCHWNRRGFGTAPLAARVRGYIRPLTRKTGELSLLVAWFVGSAT